MTSILNVVSTAYRATIEEQDDTILWLSQSMRNAGGNVDVLLAGAAVNYLIFDQNAAGLTIGQWAQTCPPIPQLDIQRFLESSGAVMAVADDLRDRGLADEQLIGDVAVVERHHLPILFRGYDRVLYW